MLKQLKIIAKRSATVLLLIVLNQLSFSDALAEQNQSAGAAPDLRIALLAAETRFDTNTMELTPAGTLALEDLFKQLKEYHEILAIRIIGHTDDVGSIKFNKSLSTARANYIKQKFARYYSDVHLIAIGLGESQPIASNQTADGRALNRRVEIQVVARGYMSGVEDASATNN